MVISPLIRPAHLTAADKARQYLRVSSQGTLYNLELRPGLSDWEVQDAARIVRWLKGTGPFFGIAGHMLVVGPPRQGKGTFANCLTWKIAHYFCKHVVRDDKPTQLWTDTVGPYTRFNLDVLESEIGKMEEIAADDGENTPLTAAGKVKKLTKAEKGKREQQYISRWASEKGEVMLQDSILDLDEYWRYVSNRRPATNMLFFIEGLVKMWGHLDMLLMGLAQNEHDIDRFKILPYVTHLVRVQMNRSPDRTPTTVVAHLHRVLWNARRQEFIDQDAPTHIYLDGALPDLGSPEPILGGKCGFDLFNSKTAPALGLITRVNKEQKENNDVLKSTKVGGDALHGR